MCGISAILTSGTTLSSAQLANSADALGHRGPDGFATWLSPDRCVGLAHTQLNITTATTPQPIANEDQSCWIIHNGEFYDHARLRSDLEARGHVFRTNSDSEVALHLYETFGTSCLHYLRGEFAFIIWDGRKQTLFAARDRWGIKPLFYANHGERLLFASEAKALFALGLPSAWNHQAVYQRLHLCYHDDGSLFANVKQLPSAHFMLVQMGQSPIIRRYWDVDFPTSHAQAGLDETAIVGQLHDALFTAVSQRLSAHVQVGCLLSGGLDSSTALAMAQAMSPTPVPAFTIAFDQSQHDESTKAQETADFLNTPLHIIDASDSALADVLADAVVAGEMIQLNAHGTARYLLSRAIRDAGYRAVLAGEGADEAFAGYGFVHALLTSDKAKRPSPTTLLRGLLKGLTPLSAENKPLAHTSAFMARLAHMLPLTDQQMQSFRTGFGMVDGMLAAGFRNQFASYDPYWHFIRSFEWRAQLLGRERAKQLIYVWLRSIFAQYHLAADRLDMAHGVEVRLPFLDHKLFSLAGGLPTLFHSQNGIRKYLLRRVAERYLPSEIVYRPKQPFYAPPIALRKASKLRQLTADVIHSQTMADLPFIDQAAFIKLFNRTPSMTPFELRLADPILMMAVSLCFLHEGYGL